MASIHERKSLSTDTTSPSDRPASGLAGHWIESTESDIAKRSSFFDSGKKGLFAKTANNRELVLPELPRLSTFVRICAAVSKLDPLD